jgi:hypothetical protein
MPESAYLVRQRRPMISGSIKTLLLSSGWTTARWRGVRGVRGTSRRPATAFPAPRASLRCHAFPNPSPPFHSRAASRLLSPSNLPCPALHAPFHLSSLSCPLQTNVANSASFDSPLRSLQLLLLFLNLSFSSFAAEYNQHFRL